MLAAVVAGAVAFSPVAQIPSVAPVRPAMSSVVMSAPAYGRRAALLAALAAVPAANADIADIAAKNAELAAAARTPEALAAKKAEEDAQEGSQLAISLGIGGLLLASTAFSFQGSGTTENVKRLGDKVKTGKGRSRY